MPEPIDLVLEHLKLIQDRLGRLETGQAGILEELRAHKSLIAGALHSQAFHEASMAEIVHRIDRIEARLELRDK